MSAIVQYQHFLFSSYLYCRPGACFDASIEQLLEWQIVLCKHFRFDVGQLDSRQHNALGVEW